MVSELKYANTLNDIFQNAILNYRNYTERVLYNQT